MTRRGFFGEFIGTQMLLAAGLAVLVQAPIMIGGEQALAAPARRLFFLAYLLAALAWSIRTAIRRLPEACAWLVRAARRLDRLDGPQRVYPVVLSVAALLGVAWMAIAMLSHDVPRAFWVEPRDFSAVLSNVSVGRARSAMQFVLFEAFVLLDAALAFVCFCIVARRSRSRKRAQSSA